MRKVTFVLPVYQGNGMRGGEIGPVLADHYPESTIIAVFYGIERYNLPALPKPFIPIWSKPALEYAWAAGQRTYSGRCIDKGSNNEPLIIVCSNQLIVDYDSYVEQAVSSDGLVVRDLVHTAQRNSADELATKIWRRMYWRAMRSRPTFGHMPTALIYPSLTRLQQIITTTAYIRTLLKTRDRLNRYYGHGELGLNVLAAYKEGMSIIFESQVHNCVSGWSADTITDQYYDNSLVIEAAIAAYPDILG